MFEFSIGEIELIKVILLYINNVVQTEKIKSIIFHNNKKKHNLELFN